MTDHSYSVEDALDSCLARISAGEPAEVCLSDFPEHADELRPMLAALLELGSWQPPTISTKTRTAVRRRAHVALRQAHPRRASWGWGRWALRMGAAALLIAALLGSGVAFAGASLPGTPLYPLKRLGEHARLALAIGSASQVDQHLALAQHRVDEITALARAGAVIDPELIADLDAHYLKAADAIKAAEPSLRPDLLMVYHDQIASQQTILGAIDRDGLDDAARLAIDDASRAVVAAGAIVPSSGPAEMPATDPEPTMEDTARPTAPATATASPKPSQSPTARPSMTPRPTARPTDLPTASPLPSPTASPLPAVVPTPTAAPPTAAPPTAAPPTAAPPTAAPTDEGPSGSFVTPTRAPSATTSPDPGGDDRPGGGGRRPAPTPEPTKPRETETPERRPTDEAKPSQTPEPEPTDDNHHGETETPEPRHSETPLPEETTTSKPTETPRPTETREPTETRKPTETREPTETPHP
ncbi:hypothetical protein K2Z83_05250 [Oscillochloris sp. ZM17-4]|uniref:DUF5667 domain-containing protein n=1 Tax=Oscillochloris sp. ZM17-4 TaxID=2866714 RepID=UPI001C72E560|nr:DUF5667 domain-containing protein [Oscillochloris sp. ZM17-4]MBX0327089.1 hypothetical protein [Oscillochloris sp. ZM17-4]